ncbi:glutathione S-transferase family protein [Dyella nitratireducens]|uniref:Glutathione S-transferase n=1 Tax=Dyella nitratireducens TaxID=1849580 RepID=A0ABQ1FUH2_9GAMM|nr:glutathione S-transferase family protein [Dyella nitratireducens]GGA31141.1 glutathione S-transferase [Dyella nitratireducens]GLQ42913.1 glutathione S-transferase [Dyella nitratireducens]
MNRKITFYHAPNSRSGGTFALLEELSADYELHLVNLKAGESRRPDYRAINPMGKVPAIRHGEVLITEQPAIFMYLADLYAEAGLAPAIGDPLRGAYLRWLVFYGSCFEPALVDRSLNREPAPPSKSPYGSWEDVINTLQLQLAKGPYMLGERFTAADVLWGGALHWATLFKLVPETPQISAYIDRVITRPAMQRVAARDADYLAQQAA